MVSFIKRKASWTFIACIEQCFMWQKWLQMSVPLSCIYSCIPHSDWFLACWSAHESVQPESSREHSKVNFIEGWIVMALGAFNHCADGSSVLYALMITHFHLFVHFITLLSVIRCFGWILLMHLQPGHVGKRCRWSLWPECHSAGDNSACLRVYNPVSYATRVTNSIKTQ